MENLFQSDNANDEEFDDQEMIKNLKGESKNEEESENEEGNDKEEKKNEKIIYQKYNEKKNIILKVKMLRKRK